MNREAEVTKRRVEISVGVPDCLADAPVDKNAGMPHHDECYFLTFIDVTEEDGATNSMTAQTTCLCMLTEATVAWLQGASEEELKKVLSGGHEHDTDHNDDAPSN